MSAEPQQLRIFISYAHEDLPIANAVSKCLLTALGNVFAVINIDRSFLDAGVDFRNQIKARLRESDIFISLYTGLDKQWPAWEIGYFEGLMSEADRPRKLIPLFFKKPPDSIANYEGLKLDIPPQQLQGSLESFRGAIQRFDDKHPMCMFVSDQQAITEKYREAAGFPPARREPEQSAVLCVQNMMLDIFCHLRSSVEATFKPQKQIAIRTSDLALHSNDPELPPDALLVPTGDGDPMTIFGLTNAERTWSKFLQDVAGDDHLESWRASIVSVVTSSLDSRINVDNSQIIVSAGGERAYRVILTSALKFYDGKREFSLYFVETLKRGDYGSRRTTVLLKAIELVCRFRFMFFENGSAFSVTNIKLTPPLNLPSLAAKLMFELNLMRKDAREAGLDQPAAWLEIVERAYFQENVEGYQPLEKAMRALSSKILEARGDEPKLLALREQLVSTLEDLEQRNKAGNARMIQQMTAFLQTETATH